MTLSYVTLTLDLYDGQGNYPVSGTATFTSPAVLTDAGVEITGQIPVITSFQAGSLPSVSLLATDNSGPLPSGWTWGVSFSGITGAPAAFSFSLPSSAVPVTATYATPCMSTVGSDATGAGTAYSNGAGCSCPAGRRPAGSPQGSPTMPFGVRDDVRARPPRKAAPRSALRTAFPGP